MSCQATSQDQDGRGPAKSPALAAQTGSGEARPELPADRYLDREQSWIQFNQRVLELAEDASVPLLERVRFLAIFASNLDEFFMVRVAGLMRRMAAGFPVNIPSGHTPVELLHSTLTKTGVLSGRHADVFTDLVKPELARHDIEILRWKELTGSERTGLAELFRNRIYPVLTPLVVDPAHPFPFISGLSLNLAVTLTDPVTGATMFARVKVPPSLPRFLNVNQFRYVPIEDVIAAHLDELFGGMDIIEHYVFRVTRVRELEVDEDVTENLLQAMEQELLKRRFEPAVRLEVEQDMSEDVLCRLARELSVDENAVYRLPGPLDLTGLTAIADLPLPEQRYPQFVPNAKAVPTDTSIFAALDERDIAGTPPLRLVHDDRAATGRGGRRRPPGARHQADGVPHQRREPDRGRPHRRGRGGQAGRGGGGAQGAVRRAGEHHLGAQA